MRTQGKEAKEEKETIKWKGKNCNYVQVCSYIICKQSDNSAQRSAQVLWTLRHIVYTFLDVQGIFPIIKAHYLLKPFVL